MAQTIKVTQPYRGPRGHLEQQEVCATFCQSCFASLSVKVSPCVMFELQFSRSSFVRETQVLSLFWTHYCCPGRRPYRENGKCLKIDWARDGSIRSLCQCQNGDWTLSSNFQAQDFTIMCHLMITMNISGWQIMWLVLKPVQYPEFIPGPRVLMTHCTMGNLEGPG